MTAHVEKTPIDDEIADLGTAQHHLQVRQTAIYVYEWPVRLWHWVNVAAILVLAVTGYFIASPPASMPGEASAHFLMGYIRFAHFTAGFIMAVGMIGRIYWAFVGNVHARQMFVLPFWSCKFWREVLIEAQWYAFLRDYPKKYVGHNPLAQLAMVTIYSVGSIFMIVTGLALYAEGAGQGSLVRQGVRLGHSADRQLAEPPHDPSSRHVGDHPLRDHPRLCRHPRGHHEPAEHDQHHGQRLAHVQG